MRELIAVTGLLIALASGAAADDVADGRAWYETECAPCHFAADLPLHGDADPTARPIPVMMATYGPKLIGIVGRAAGTDPNFLYSANFSEATQGLIWTEAVLDEFLIDSQIMFPGTRMFYRQPDADIRRKILAYLKTTG